MSTDVYIKWNNGKVEKKPLHLATIGIGGHKKIIGYIKHHENKIFLKDFDPVEYGKNDARIYKLHEREDNNEL